LGLHCYAVSTYPGELVLEPPIKNPESAYAKPVVVELSQKWLWISTSK